MITAGRLPEHARAHARGSGTNEPTGACCMRGTKRRHGGNAQRIAALRVSGAHMHHCRQRSRWSCFRQSASSESVDKGHPPRLDRDCSGLTKIGACFAPHACTWQQRHSFRAAAAPTAARAMNRRDDDDAEMDELQGGQAQQQQPWQQQQGVDARRRVLLALLLGLLAVVVLYDLLSQRSDANVSQERAALWVQCPRCSPCLAAHAHQHSRRLRQWQLRRRTAPTRPTGTHHAGRAMGAAGARA